MKYVASIEHRRSSLRSKLTSVADVVLRAGKSIVGLLALAGFAPSAISQTWTPVARHAPSNISLLILMSDGSVMASANGTAAIEAGWYRLSPDTRGSYANGTWSSRASMHDTRLYYSSQVLRDGRLFVAGGEYGSGTSKSEIYDLTTNTWTALPIPTSILDPNSNSPVTGGSQAFDDSCSELLPDGRVMISPVSPRYSHQTVLFDPATSAWSAGPNLRATFQAEASWVKLPDDSILTVDPGSTSTERYIPAQNAWIADATVPTQLYDIWASETGPALLLHTGKAFFIGSSGHTAIYTPSGSTAPGRWQVGPDVPGGLGAPDAPAAVLPNGHVLCAVSPAPTNDNHFPAPTSFFEYDPIANVFTPVNGPHGATEPTPTYPLNMLVLPTGGVLVTFSDVDLYIYTSNGTPLDVGKPSIQSVTRNANNTFHITGTGFNGLNAGAAYGDDAQMNSNYPLVRCAFANGNIAYARTFNWSSNGVQTGTRVVSTDYALPSGFPAGAYALSVVANGIASDPVSRPTITIQPASQTSCPGSTITLHVAASGLGPINYQWLRGSMTLTNGGNISGADTDTLTISSVTRTDALTSYSCFVSNVLGRLSSTTASITLCTADVDDGSASGTCDGGVTIDDLLYYVDQYARGAAIADVDDGTSTGTPDGGITIEDLLYYLLRYVQGC